MKRLRDSRSYEVARERARVEAAMTDKFSRCIDRVWAHLKQRDLLEKEQNLVEQASGTKKCLEMIKEEKLGITQDLIDLFAKEEAEHTAKAAKLGVASLSDEDLTLSPLVLPTRSVSDGLMATLNPYGSNVDLFGSEVVTQLQAPTGAAESNPFVPPSGHPDDAAQSSKGSEQVSAKEKEEDDDEAESIPSLLLVRTEEPLEPLGEKGQSPPKATSEKPGFLEETGEKETPEGVPEVATVAASGGGDAPEDQVVEAVVDDTI